MTPEPLRRIGFAGTPIFAAQVLQGLLDHDYPISLVLTKPDRPAGRGLALTPSPVKTLALSHHIPVWQPLTLKDQAIQAELLLLPLDLLIVVAYGLLLPATILSWPRLGCFNIHASSLPRWRGAAPIQRAILAGDPSTGICIMQMETGLDTGSILRQAIVPISDMDTSGSLHDKLATVGTQTILQTLQDLGKTPNVQAIPQSTTGITYADKIQKHDTLINWQQSATQIDRQIRAFSPTPGAFTYWQGETLKVWTAKPLDEANSSNFGARNKEPGQIEALVDNGFVVVCGRGKLLIQTVQRAGGKKIPAHQYLCTHSSNPAKMEAAKRNPQIGDQLGLPTNAANPPFPDN